MYYSILNNALKEMALLRAQVRKLNAAMHPAATAPLWEKHTLYRQFLVAAFLFTALEAVCDGMYGSKRVRFIAILTVYEAGSTALVILICWALRPRVYSPFFFVMPTSMENNSDEGDEVERQFLASGNPRREHEDDVAALERRRLSRAQR